MRAVSSVPVYVRRGDEDAAVPTGGITDGTGSALWPADEPQERAVASGDYITFLAEQAGWITIELAPAT